MALVLIGAGCNLQPHARDEATIRGIARTIENREKDFGLWKAELAKPNPAERDLRGLQALQDAELDRLRQSKAYEEAKEAK